MITDQEGKTAVLFIVVIVAILLILANVIRKKPIKLHMLPHFQPPRPQ